MEEGILMASHLSTPELRASDMENFRVMQSDDMRPLGTTEPELGSETQEGRKGIGSDTRPVLP